MYPIKTKQNEQERKKHAHQNQYLSYKPIFTNLITS